MRAIVTLACAGLSGFTLGACGSTGLSGSPDAWEDHLTTDGLDEPDALDLESPWDAPVDPVSEPHPDPGMPDYFPDPPDECVPPGGVVVDFEIDGTALPGPIDIIRACTIESIVVDEAEHQIITLQCDSPDGGYEMHEIDLFTSPFGGEIRRKVGGESASARDHPFLASRLNT